MGLPADFFDASDLSEPERVRLLGQSVDQHAAAVVWQAALTFGTCIPAVAATTAPTQTEADAPPPPAPLRASAAALDGLARRAAGGDAKQPGKPAAAPVWATSVYHTALSRDSARDALQRLELMSAPLAADDQLSTPLWQPEDGDTAWRMDEEVLLSQPAALDALRFAW